MLTLLSFSSFFSSFAGQRERRHTAALSAHERNEKYEQTCSRAKSIFSVISSDSFLSFSLFFRDAAYIPPFRPGAISNSQPTRCGHTLRGAPCRGLASGCAPSNPAKAERQTP